MNGQYQAGNASLFSVIARGHNRAPVVRCYKCHKEFTLGVNGIETGNGNVCDNCGNVARDIGGYAWVSETEMCMCYEVVEDNPDCPVHGGG